MNVAKVTGDAAVANAGVTAFLAPLIGPAAVAAGAGVGAEVLSLAPLASAAIGGYVLSDGLAQIHAGETIVPAALSQPTPAARPPARRPGPVRASSSTA